MYKGCALSHNPPEIPICTSVFHLFPLQRVERRKFFPAHHIIQRRVGFAVRVHEDAEVFRRLFRRECLRYLELTRGLEGGLQAERGHRVVRGPFPGGYRYADVRLRYPFVGPAADPERVSTADFHPRLELDITFYALQPYLPSVRQCYPHRPCHISWRHLEVLCTPEFTEQGIEGVAFLAERDARTQCSAVSHMESVQCPVRRGHNHGAGGDPDEHFIEYEFVSDVLLRDIEESFSCGLSGYGPEPRLR